VAADPIPVWDLSAADLDWVVRVMRLRRENLVAYAPTFWKPAADATARHRAFLSQLIGDPEVLGMRTQHGCLLALRREAFWLVDDVVVTPAEKWPTSGAALLTRALDRCGHIRLVVPAFERGLFTTARTLGLEPAECWWHRDLYPAVDEPQASDPDASMTVDGTNGRLVTAPPVYDPGGPVLLVNEVTSVQALRSVEAAAARRGARVSVVSQDPSRGGEGRRLEGCGYVLTTVFFETPR
jgi:hypothetical protein